MDELYDKRIKTSFGEFDSMKHLETLTEERMKFQDEYKGNTFKRQLNEISRTEVETNLIQHRAKFYDFNNQTLTSFRNVELQNRNLNDKEIKDENKKRLKLKSSFQKKYAEFNLTESKLDNLVEAQIINDARAKYRDDLYKQYMKEHSIKKESAIPLEEQENLSIASKFCFYDSVEKQEGDNFPGESRIKEYISNMRFEFNMLGKFTVDYVRDNYPKALQELNRLKGVAEYAHKYGMQLFQQNLTIEQLDNLVAACNTMFLNSLSVCGYAYSEEETTHKSSLKPANEEQMDALNVTRTINDTKKIFVNINYEEDLRKLELELDTKFNYWRDSEYQEQISEKAVYIRGLITREDLINKLDGKDSFQKICSEYELNDRVIVYHNAQIAYLMKERNALKETEFQRRYFIDHKLTELRTHKYELIQSNEMIDGIINSLETNKTLSTEQIDYIYMKTGAFSNEITMESQRMLNESKVVDHMVVQPITKDALMSKVEDLYKEIKNDIKPSMLVKYQYQLCLLVKEIAKVDKKELDAMEKFKCDQIEINAKKARLAVIYIASKRNVDVEAFLTKEELSYFTDKGIEVNRNSINEYVKEKYEIEYQNQSSKLAELFNDDAYKEEFLIGLSELGHLLYKNIKRESVKNEKLKDITANLRKELEDKQEETQLGIDENNLENKIKTLKKESEEWSQCITKLNKVKKKRVEVKEILQENSWKRTENCYKIKSNHKHFSKKLLSMSEYSATSKHQYQVWINQLKDDKISEEDKMQIKENIAYLEIYAKLVQSDYFLAGRQDIKVMKVSGNKVNGDKIMRSIINFDSIPEIAHMTDEEIFEMTHKMSVGVFEEEKISWKKLREEEVSKERFEKITKDVTEESLLKDIISDKKFTNEDRIKFRSVNSKGMEIYKSKLLVHYKNVYKKYGLELKKPEFYCTNYKEINSDIPESQVHEMISYDQNNYDFSKTEDRLLYSLIGYYRSIMASISAGINDLKSMESSYVAGTLENYIDKEMKKNYAYIHYAYLKEHEGELA